MKEDGGRLFKSCVFDRTNLDRKVCNILTVFLQPPAS